MKIKLLHVPIAVCLCLLHCNRHQPAPAAPPAVQPAVPAAGSAPTPARFGAPLSETPAILASTLIADPARYNNQQVKISGVVGGVCQKKGCWMTLGSGEPSEKTVRVTFKDYAFFVPTGSMGKQATVEGIFRIETLSKEQAQHYADDAARAGAPAQKVTGPQETLALVATGVEIR